MLEQIILGSIQGITEWLPVSSEAILVLVQTHFFGDATLEHILRGALLLHFGTLLAATVYFRSTIGSIFKDMFNYSSAEIASKKLIQFLFITTLISGSIGILFLSFLNSISSSAPGSAVTIFIGVLLLITGILQLRVPKTTYKKMEDLTLMDSIILGVTQGFAVLPGFSRSGLTVSTLLLRKYDKKSALTLSFLMSIPIVFAGNIVLNFNTTVITLSTLFGLLASFVFGLVTIKTLMVLARKVNFGYFVIIFGVLAIIAGIL